MREKKGKIRILVLVYVRMGGVAAAMHACMVRTYVREGGGGTWKGRPEQSSCCFCH